MISSMFPRIQANDAEKGGGSSSAPSRNKTTTLYNHEQLSMIPSSSSNRFGSASIFPSLDPSIISSIHEYGGSEKKICKSSGFSHLVQHPRRFDPSNETRFEVTMAEEGVRKPMKNPHIDPSPNAPPLEQLVLSTFSNYNSFRPNFIPNFNNFSSKKPDIQHRPNKSFSMQFQIDASNMMQQPYENYTRGPHHRARSQSDDIVSISIERCASAPSSRTCDSCPWPPLCYVKSKERLKQRDVSPSGLCTNNCSIDVRKDISGSTNTCYGSTNTETTGSNSPCCSSSVITPDQVMNVMGVKQFQIARRAMINQQRIFAMQVFELHRLIQVQKSIPTSLDSLLEDKGSNNTPSIDPPSAKKHQSRHFIKPQQQQQLHNKPHSTCFLQAGNQWLVPIMSPSEGLIYKPCFPPYDMNMMMMPSTARNPPSLDHRHQIGHFTTPLLSNKGDQASSVRDGNMTNVPCKSSSSTNLVIKVQSDDDDDALLPLFPLEPSTRKAGSRCDHESCKNEMNGGQHVIKVVPRNPRLATESTAKIFELIQEDRKRKHDQMLE